MIMMMSHYAYKFTHFVKNYLQIYLCETYIKGVKFNSQTNGQIRLCVFHTTNQLLFTSYNLFHAPNIQPRMTVNTCANEFESQSHMTLFSSFCYS